MPNYVAKATNTTEREKSHENLRGLRGSSCLRGCSVRLLRQREDDDLVRRDNRDVLLAVLRLIRHRVRVAARRQLRDPQFLARLRVERAETPIVRRSDEHETTGRDARTRASAA